MTVDKPALQSAHILLVDDEAAIRSVLRQLLESFGHKVVDVASAEQAVERIRAGYVPELVLLDRSMPGWPVRRAITEIRAEAKSAAIVLFTGQGVPDDEAALVDGVLYKPMTVEELHQAIARFARAPG